jgi:hypothetical protein
MMKNSYGGEANGKKRPTRIFVPVTMKMVSEAEIGKDDSCEIDGEPINEVSTTPQTIVISKFNAIQN